MINLVLVVFQFLGGDVGAVTEEEALPVRAITGPCYLRDRVPCGSQDQAQYKADGRDLPVVGPMIHRTRENSHCLPFVLWKQTDARNATRPVHSNRPDFCAVPPDTVADGLRSLHAGADGQVTSIAASDRAMSGRLV